MIEKFLMRWGGKSVTEKLPSTNPLFLFGGVGGCCGEEFVLVDDDDEKGRGFVEEEKEEAVDPAERIERDGQENNRVARHRSRDNMDVTKRRCMVNSISLRQLKEAWWTHRRGTRGEWIRWHVFCIRFCSMQRNISMKCAGNRFIVCFFSPLSNFFHAIFRPNPR